MSSDRLIIKICKPHIVEVLAQLLGCDAQVAVDQQGDCWLRFAATQSIPQTQVAKLPVDHYQLAHDHWLIPVDSHVATATLPSGLTWQPLDPLVSLRVPVARLAGRIPSQLRVPLRLVRGGTPQTPQFLRVPLTALARWAESISGLRLQPLQWVLCGQIVLVYGNPLPSMVGQYYCLHETIIIPAGFQWQPHLEAWEVAALLRNEAELPDDVWICWDEDQSISAIPQSMWRPLSRSSLRIALKSAPTLSAQRNLP